MPFEITSQAGGLWWSICRDYKVSTQHGIVAYYCQIRYTMEKQRVIMTSDNQQTSLSYICNPGGKGSQTTPSPLNPSGVHLD